MKTFSVVFLAVIIGSASAVDWGSVIKGALGSSICSDPKTVNPAAVKNFAALQTAINATISMNKKAVKCDEFRAACQSVIKNNFPCIDSEAFANHEANYCAILVK